MSPRSQQSRREDESTDELKKVHCRLPFQRDHFRFFPPRLPLRLQQRTTAASPNSVGWKKTM